MSGEKACSSENIILYLPCYSLLSVKTTGYIIDSAHHLIVLNTETRGTSMISLVHGLQDVICIFT